MKSNFMFDTIYETVKILFITQLNNLLTHDCLYINLIVASLYSVTTHHLCSCLIVKWF